MQGYVSYSNKSFDWVSSRVMFLIFLCAVAAWHLCCFLELRW